MKKIFSIIPLILLMNLHSFGQYKTANEVIKYINDNLKDYSVHDLKKSNSISVNSEGQIIITHTSGSSKEILKANIKALDGRVDLILSDEPISPEESNITMRCLNKSDCVLETLDFAPFLDGKVSSRKSPYLSFNFSINSQGKNIADAFSYLIMKTNQGDSFLVGVKEEPTDVVKVKTSTIPTTQTNTRENNKKTIEWIKSKIDKFNSQKVYRGCSWDYFYVYIAANEYIESAIFSGSCNDDLKGCDLISEDKIYYKDIISYTSDNIDGPCDNPSFTFNTYGKGVFELKFNTHIHRGIEVEPDFFNRMNNAFDDLIKQNEILYPKAKETY